MRISRESLEREAAATEFRAEILEKVIHFFSLLDVFQKHPFLKGKWALKGGTALNLFWFDVPRLSVDIDLNYIGQVEREAMLAECPKN
jgi:predicted nucleotidyltransferase component of viral defense system